MSTAEIIKCQSSDIIKYLSVISTASRSCNYPPIFSYILKYFQIFICSTNRTNLTQLPQRNVPTRPLHTHRLLGHFHLPICNLSGTIIFYLTAIFGRSWTLKMKTIISVKILCCHISGNLLLLHPEKPVQVLVGTLPGLDDCLCHRINVRFKHFPFPHWDF